MAKFTVARAYCDSSSYLSRQEAKSTVFDQGQA